jgi:hypothetical protein
MCSVAAICDAWRGDEGDGDDEEATRRREV